VDGMGCKAAGSLSSNAIRLCQSGLSRALQSGRIQLADTGRSSIIVWVCQSTAVPPPASSDKGLCGGRPYSCCCIAHRTRVIGTLKPLT
jgi:hypothetical protein